MEFLSIMCSVVDSPVSDVPITEAPAITDNATEIASGLAADFTDKFLNMDFINELLPQYAKVFAIGFALTTLLVLITYGVFKAFSLVRIDS